MFQKQWELYISDGPGNSLFPDVDERVIPMTTLRVKTKSTRLFQGGPIDPYGPGIYLKYHNRDAIKFSCKMALYMSLPFLSYMLGVSLSNGSHVLPCRIGKFPNHDLPPLRWSSLFLVKGNY